MQPMTSNNFGPSTVNCQQNLPCVDFIYGWFLPDRLEWERVAGGAAEVLVEVGEVLDAVGRGLSSGRLVNGESVALNESRWPHLSANVTLAEVEQKVYRVTHLVGKNLLLTFIGLFWLLIGC